MAPGSAEDSADKAVRDPIVTLDRIYKDKDFQSDWFGGTVWLEDGSGYTLIEKTGESEDHRSVVKYDPETGASAVLISAEDVTPEGSEKPVKIESVQWSADGTKALIYANSKRVWRYKTQGDYWILDITSKAFHKLGAGFPASSLMFAKFSPDGTRVAYVQKTGKKIHDIYVENITTQEKTRLTSDGSETIINGTFDWVYEEELGLRDGFRWSPDGTKIAYWQLDASGVKDFTLINNTDSLYPELTTFSYPKVGETNSAAKVGVVSASGGETTWMAIDGDPRNHYLAWMEWTANSDEIAVQQLNRRQNTNKLILAKVTNGESRTVFTDSDDAWLDAVNDFRWLDDGKAFLWVSEQGGWRQLLRVSRDGQTVTKITGDYDVMRIRRIDLAAGTVYFDASPDNPRQQYLYKVNITDGKPAVRLTPGDEPGHHGYDVSADGAYAFQTSSARDKATTIRMIRLADHTAVKTFVDNAALQAKYDTLDKGRLEQFQVTVDDGQDLHGVIRFPADFDASKKYPVIFYVYGEPWSSTGSDRWYADSELWHIMMTQKGYIFVTLDNRGQPMPKGRAWRKSIYRKLGLVNVDDQAMAAKKLTAQRPYMDADRMGIWGHSGGGTSTLHALFRHGDVFKVGVSRAPVPDIRLYDTIYQERYSGILPDDADYYEKSVAINYAGGLTGKLLLIHGTGDDNVHYQGSERLINKLIEEGIQFDFFAYPNRTHGIREGKNTTHHLMTMQTNYFLTHLKPGPLDR